MRDASPYGRTIGITRASSGVGKGANMGGVSTARGVVTKVAMVFAVVASFLVPLVVSAEPASATFPSSQGTDEGAILEFGTRYDATFTPIGSYYQVIGLRDGAVLYSQNLPLGTYPDPWYQDGPAGQFYTQDVATGSNIVTAYGLSGGMFDQDFTFTAPTPTNPMGLIDFLAYGQWVGEDLFAFTRSYGDISSGFAHVFEFVDISDPANPVILPSLYSDDQCDYWGNPLPEGQQGELCFSLPTNTGLKFFKDEKILYWEYDNMGVPSNRIYDIATRQTALVPVDGTMYGPQNLQFSPDGSMLAYSQSDQMSHVTTFNILDASDPSVILHQWTISDAIITPAPFDWSPDSSGLIYQVGDQENLQIDYYLDGFGASRTLLYESATGDLTLGQQLSWIEDPRGPVGGDSTTVTNSGGDTITISSPTAGTTISSAIAIDPPAAPPTPAGVDFPFGLLDFTISGVAPGGTIPVVIDLPSAPDPGWSFWKLQGGAYADASSIASLSGSTLTLSLQDNGPFDADPTPGVIHDPGGVGVPAADSTPPDITITTPADGATYPVGAAVTADYDCTDAESGVATCDGDVASGAAIDTSVVGSDTFTVDASDVAGNTSSLTHTYTVVDTTAPTSTATPNGTAGLGGWYTSPVTVDLMATDADSDVASITYQASGAQTIASTTVAGSTASPVISADGITTLSFSATDTAGNVEPNQAINVTVDSGAPNVAITTPSDGATYELNDSATVAFACDDAVSGLASCVGSVASGADLDTSTLGSQSVTVTGTDVAGNQTVVTHDYSVVDTVAPTVGEPVVTPNPVSVDATSLLQVDVSDDGSGLASAEWFLDTDPGQGDGEPMAISGGVATATIGAGLEPGVYTVSVRAQDNAGNWSAPSETLLVVYDPEGGFVTGGGWIDSPEGALAADPNASGRANFGFVSKYKKGATIPTGQTEFRFVAGDLDFHSSSYDWLVVNQGGTRAQFKGSGTINGAGAYRFMIWATDDSPDTFRIRIWTEDSAGGETTVYDNGTDQPIGGGNVVVHTKKK